MNFAGGGVWSQQLDPRHMGHDQFLLPCAREVAQDRLVDGVRSLQCQVVKEHYGRTIETVWQE